MGKLVTIGKHQYEMRDRIPYYEEVYRQGIIDLYGQKYGVVIYTKEDLPKIRSEWEKEFKKANPKASKKYASDMGQLFIESFLEAQGIAQKRLEIDPEFGREITRFNFKPIGSAPSLDEYIESGYDFTEKEEGYYREGLRFFWHGASKSADEPMTSQSDSKSSDRSQRKTPSAQANTSRKKTRKRSSSNT